MPLEDHMRHLKVIISIVFFILPAILFVYSVSKASDLDLTRNYRVVGIHSHDPNAQTEGLQYMDGFLYEGTGPCINAPSGLRKIDMTSGDIVMIRELPQLNLFGEGITIFNGKIIELTYKTRIGFVYDKKNFELLKEFYYSTEGWGITNDGENLIMSDGSDILRYLDPETFKEVKRVAVRDDSGPVYKLNELEYIDGEIYANVFETSRIVCILPETGQVVGSINLSVLLKGQFPIKDPIDLANGIAYDHGKDRLFVTGKYWSKMYELETINKGGRHHKGGGRPDKDKPEPGDARALPPADAARPPMH
jgi:glutaminyl-peptide cyclotransferase